jgi:hypothetical protein
MVTPRFVWRPPSSPRTCMRVGLGKSSAVSRRRAAGVQVEENVVQSEDTSWLFTTVRPGRSSHLGNQHTAWPFTTAQRGSTRLVDLNASEFSSMRKSKHIAVARYCLITSLC